MTQSESLRLMAAVVATWPVPAVEDCTIRQWADAIADLDRDLSARAFRELRGTMRERPMPCDLRRLVLDYQRPADWLSPEEAWAYITRCFSRVGACRPFPADQPLIKRVVDGFGWEIMCATQTADIPTLRAQFRNAYTATLTAALSASQATPGARPTSLPAPPAPRPTSLPGAPRAPASARDAVAVVMAALESASHSHARGGV